MSRNTPAPWINDRSGALRDAAEAIARQYPYGYTDEMIAANLQLILLAPELFEALIDLYNYVFIDLQMASKTDFSHHPAVSNAKALLNRACY